MILKYCFVYVHAGDVALFIVAICEIFVLMSHSVTLLVHSIIPY